MATATLLRALRRPSSQIPLRLTTNAQFQFIGGSNRTTSRNLSVFNEFSKKLKGEAKSNPEFQQSVKELNEKIGGMTEDLKVRTKKTAEKLYKSVDDVWTEAEETSKKVSANMKEKITVAKEEVKQSFGINKDETTGPTSTNPDTANPSSSHQSHNPNTTSNANNSTNANATNQGQFGYSEILGRFKSTISSASPVFSSAFQKLRETRVSNLAKKGIDLVKDELSSSGRVKSKKMQKDSAVPGERSTRTDIVFVPTKRSKLGKKWEAFKQKMHVHPVFKRVSGYTQPVVNKGQEIAEDMRERWETSDHPVVHKIQDLNETVFGETATALSFKEIRRRDPTFSLPDFVSEVQDIIRPVLTSYSKGDVETLKKYCTREVLERCNGERKAYETQGMFFDHKILHISEVDVRETKMMGSSPIVVLAFQTQQIYCVRDRQGEITAGGKDTIHTMYYLWAMQLIEPEELGEDSYYPIWKLREMQQLGIQALI